LVRAVPPYVPGEQPAVGRRVIKLNTNENPYPPSPRVRDALGAFGAERLRLYPDPGARRLRERIAETYGRPVEGVLVGNGSDELITLLVRGVVEPGDAVAFPVPTYSLYETVVALHGARSVQVPFPADWRLPVGALVAVRASLTFVCSPNSPSGTGAALADLEALARGAAGVVVVDEAYADFGDADALALLDRLSNVVVLRTLSKSFALAGVRVGFALGHPDLLAGLATLKDSYNVSCLAQVAAEAALGDLAHMRAGVARIRATRRRLAGALDALGYRVPPSAANFVLAVRPGVDQAPVAAALAERGILVRHFATPRLQDALRVSVGTDAEIDTLVAALGEIVAPHAT
jgi:histidinol-phosphate aminotransferase